MAEKKLVQTDPSLSDSPVEDDLLEGLKTSGLPHREEIIDKINDSASAFLKAPGFQRRAHERARSP